MSQPSDKSDEDAVTIQYKGRIAIITLNDEKKLNAMSQIRWFRLAQLLMEAGANKETVITVITGSGRFFSAGADVSIDRENDPAAKENPRRFWTGQLAANNLHNSWAWYTHPKILVLAMNGPVVGIIAGWTAHADFIYAAPHAYLVTPFASLGLVVEGAASKAMADRMGSAKATEVLLTGRKITAQEMHKIGYVNKIIEGCGGDPNNGKGIDTKKFLDKVLEEVNDKLGEHLNDYALLGAKKLLKAPNMSQLHLAGFEEVWGGVDVFEKGVPQKEFQKIASGQKRHKI